MGELEDVLESRHCLICVKELPAVGFSVSRFMGNPGGQRAPNTIGQDLCIYPIVFKDYESKQCSFVP